MKSPTSDQYYYLREKSTFLEFLKTYQDLFKGISKYVSSGASHYLDT